jgi:hypothetical protein
VFRQFTTETGAAFRSCTYAEQRQYLPRKNCGGYLPYPQGLGRTRGGQTHFLQVFAILRTSCIVLETSSSDLIAIAPQLSARPINYTNSCVTVAGRLGRLNTVVSKIRRNLYYLPLILFFRLRRDRVPHCAASSTVSVRPDPIFVAVASETRQPYYYGGEETRTGSVNVKARVR